jgi:hypothetical protein
MVTLRNRNLTLYTAQASRRRLPADLLIYLVGGTAANAAGPGGLERTRRGCSACGEAWYPRLAAIAILMLAAGNILAARLCWPWHWKAPSFRLVSVGPTQYQVHRGGSR